MTTVSIELDPKLEQDLASLAARDGATRDELIARILRRYIAETEFEALRREIAPYAEAAGYKTEEDILRDIS